jgi:hypothetical protein
MEKQLSLDLIFSRPGQRPNLHRQILEAFIDGDQLTTLTALQKFRTLELRKIVADLRAAGVPVADQWQKNTSSGKRFKLYFLNRGNG